MREPLTHGTRPGQTSGTQGRVVFRDTDGRILFRAETDKTGRLRLPVDYRAVRAGQQLEAHVEIGGIEIGALVGLRMGQREYQLIVEPLAYVSIEEPGIYVDAAPER